MVHFPAVVMASKVQYCKSLFFGKHTSTKEELNKIPTNIIISTDCKSFRNFPLQIWIFAEICYFRSFKMFLLMTFIRLFDSQIKNKFSILFFPSFFLYLLLVRPLWYYPTSNTSCLQILFSRKQTSKEEKLNKITNH